jgi:hypothetical protein
LENWILKEIRVLEIKFLISVDKKTERSDTIILGILGIFPVYPG